MVGLGEFMTAHAPRASRALVNPTDNVPLHWNMTVAPPMNTPTSQKNTTVTAKE